MQSVLKKPQKRKSPPKRKEKRKGRASIYIHFPFCLYKCHYCDFNSYALDFSKIPFSEYSQALIHEITLRRQLFEENGQHFFSNDDELATVHFGGGTPSLLSPKEISSILMILQKSFKGSDSLEVTLEANPKTIDGEKLKALKSVGVNRLSMGVQSLNDKNLSRFGRIHSAQDALEATHLVDKTGFDSWNIDLIYGFPGQSMGEWLADLVRVQKMNPPHLSCYSFTVEEDAPYGQMVQKGLASPPSEDDQALMFKETENLLESCGYKHYEISNYSQPGFESRHNLNYWKYGEFIGLGAGAVSFLQTQNDLFGYRTLNLKSPNQYMKALSAPGCDSRTWFELEQIDQKTAMAEFMMMGFRLSQGIESSQFKKLFMLSVEDNFSPQIERFREKGWMASNNFSLTKKGWLFSNQMIQDLLPS